MDLRVADGSYFGHTNRRANEDYAAFGPLGSVLLVGIAVWIPIAYRRRRADRAQLALALALPCFLVLLALQSKWNGFLTRFALVAVVLVAPLFARLFRSAAVTAALVPFGVALPLCSPQQVAMAGGSAVVVAGVVGAGILASQLRAEGADRGRVAD